MKPFIQDITKGFADAISDGLDKRIMRMRSNWKPAVRGKADATLKMKTFSDGSQKLVRTARPTARKVHRSRNKY